MFVVVTNIFITYHRIRICFVLPGRERDARLSDVRPVNDKTGAPAPRCAPANPTPGGKKAGIDRLPMREKK